jgi:F0F1-type ATP synthase assembly protein I
MMMQLFDDDEVSPEEGSAPSDAKSTGTTTLNIFDESLSADAETKETEPFVLSQAEPEPYSETARKSGLAWSAGIAFFGAVVFLMILGWGFDLLFGSSPWGLVAGIVLGSIIGFVQFFRISSQIFKK